MRIFLILFLFSCAEMCSDNCMAYKAFIDNTGPDTNYRLFYLPYNTSNGCKHCYFDVNAYNPSENYNFLLGLFDDISFNFKIAITGEKTASSGFSSCDHGYCAVYFDRGFSYLTIQTAESSFSDICYFNNTYCTGTVDSRAGVYDFFSSYTDMNCVL